MKKQIWLKPEQVELIISCLELSRKQIGNVSMVNDAHIVASKYTVNRINELLSIFNK